MTDDLPDISRFCSVVAQIHLDSMGKSPNGQYGFHITTHLAYVDNDNSWSGSWEQWYARALKRMLQEEENSHGPDDELKVLTAAMFDKLRTLPKQFPPWSSDPSEGIWGIQHLLHPDMPSRDVFAASYFNDTVITTIEQLLDCEEECLVMELYNLLIRPTHDFELRWHRDDIPPAATGEEEQRRLEEPAWHAQWNLALYDDDSLTVVPGSHKRARTEQERAAEPFAKDMPGQLVVTLKAGDMVFYDNNILHRGVYDSRKERMTLHGSVGHLAGGRVRAQNVLQHGTGEWVERCRFDGLAEGMKGRAESMRQRLVEMGRAEGEGVGFSQED
ncbi:MAG: hypothetical protein Q9208_004889 [Pyrenodesmia sp. 3 TL-2023]